MGNGLGLAICRLECCPVIGLHYEVAACGRAPERAPDPMIGHRVGGVNVFGGGLGLYDATGRLLGGLGVSGDTSCADHIIAWKVRHALNLDNVPAGVAGPAKDNIIHDLTVDPATGHTTSKSGWGHPACSADSTAIANSLPTTYPTGSGQ